MGFPFIPLLLGAGAGALFNRKDPLKGALLGGALGGAGGLLAPSVLGAGGATGGFGGILGSEQAAQLAAQEAGVNTLGWGGATTGLQGGLNSIMGAETGAKAGGLLDTAGSIAKPVNAGMQAASMYQDDEPLPPPMPVNLGPGTGPQTLAQIANQGQEYANSLQMQNDQKRLERNKRIQMMGGNYGGFA